MAKKSDERNPDLLGPEYEEVEARVREMMEPEKKSIPIRHDDDAKTDSAATAPVPEKPAKDAKTTPKDKPVVTLKIRHEDSDVVEAIEATNKALQEKTAKSKKLVVRDLTEEAVVPEQSPEATEESAVPKKSKTIAVAEVTNDEPELQPEESISLENETQNTEDDAARESTDEVADDSVDPEQDTTEKAPAEPEVSIPEEPAAAIKPIQKKPATPPKVVDIAPSPIRNDIEEPGTDEVVDDILREEAASFLDQDDKLKRAAEKQEKPAKVREKRMGFGAFLKLIWGFSFTKWLLGLAIFSSVVAAGAIPESRYFMLNITGVRSSLSLTVMDESTRQPLRNVKVSAAGISAQTDKEGNVRLQNLKHGKTKLIVEKRAYAQQSRDMVVGWGSNPLGEFRLVPVGNQVTFDITDYVSGEPLANAQVTSGDSTAEADERGIAKITIDKTDILEFEAVITAEGFQEKKITVDVENKDTVAVQLIPPRKQVFVSKRTGKYDLYTIDVNGENEKLLLEGTGTERDDMVIVPHPVDEVTAVVSTREDKRNPDGFLLSTLSVVQERSGERIGVTLSERIQIIGWIQQRLVYVKVASGASAGNAQRHRLISYDYKEETSTEIATSNYFNDVTIVGDKIYFAPSSAYAGGASANLYQVNADGTGKQTVLNEETWNIFRVGYNAVQLSVQQKWFEYTPGGSSPTEMKGAPANPTTRLYTNSPDGKRSVWVDSRDGKGVLLIYDIEKNVDDALVTRPGLRQPVRWLSPTTLVFRVETQQETADYAVSILGGEPKKIQDVSAIGGVDDWYFY